MSTGLPEIGLRKLSLYISELVLISDGSKTWVGEPRVLFAWHLWFFSLLIVGVATILGNFFLSILTTHPLAASLWRYFFVLALSALAALLVNLALAYYRFLLLTGRDVRFKSITDFWFCWVGIFGLLYRSVYNTDPSLFLYPRSVVVPGPVLRDLGYFVQLQQTIHFLIYSAGVTLSINTPGLASNSFLVSFLNIVELLGSVLLIALVVATFVAKSEQFKGSR